MERLGVYNLWDDKAFTEQTAEDLLWFFRVNVVVSSSCFLDGSSPGLVGYKQWNMDISTESLTLLEAFHFIHGFHL